MLTSQRRLSLLWMCVLLFAFVLPYLFPQWETYATQFLRTHLLFLGALLLPLLFLLLWQYPQRQVAAVRDRKDRIDLESKSRQTLAQIVGGAVLLVGLYFTAQTLRTTQEGQITDRFTKAIAQLGDTNLAIRLGGIYALERIARDSASDHWSVMEVLTAFVREYSHGRSHPPWAWVSRLFVKEQLPENQAKPSPPADIQAILTVIGRRTRTFGNGETQYLDLGNTKLQGAILVGAQLQGANLWEAQLQETYLGGTDLTVVKNLTQDQINEACIDENTKLPEGLTRPAPCPESP